VSELPTDPPLHENPLDSETDVEATLASHHVWVDAGRPGAVSHEEAMRELLSGL
jgi:hypothetical protein